eukprot:6211926-Pleurochrysis_carterae.AAC.1
MHASDCMPAMGCSSLFVLPCYQNTAADFILVKPHIFVVWDERLDDCRLSGTSSAETCAWRLPFFQLCEPYAPAQLQF